MANMLPKEIKVQCLVAVRTPEGWKWADQEFPLRNMNWLLITVLNEACRYFAKMSTAVLTMQVNIILITSS